MSRNADFLKKVAESRVVTIDTRHGPVDMVRPTYSRIRDFGEQTRSDIPENESADAVLELLAEVMAMSKDEVFDAVVATGGFDGDIVRGLNKAILGNVTDAEAEETAPLDA